jgi:NADPH-dependent 2,4-dienoyl-CoA reductase/sulfur reductase-like enzyme
MLKIAPMSAKCGSRRHVTLKSVGRFEPVSRPDLFDLEYWSLEQAKLASTKAKLFTGQVAVVTGGAGAIGAATARAFAAEGAHVVVVDLSMAAES